MFHCDCFKMQVSTITYHNVMIRRLARRRRRGFTWNYFITWQVFHRRQWNFPDLSRNLLPKTAENFIIKFQILMKLLKINSWRYKKWLCSLAFWNSRMKHLITSEMFFVKEWNFPQLCRKHLAKSPENFRTIFRKLVKLFEKFSGGIFFWPTLYIIYIVHTAYIHIVIYIDM